MCLSDHVSTNQMSFVGQSTGSVVSSFQPTVMIVLPHGEGNATSLCFAVIVTITESFTSEVSNISTPIVDIVFNSG